MDVVLDRQVDDRAVAAAGDDDADLGRQRQALLEHAGDAAERRERGGQRAALDDRDLALAVVAEPRRLQDRRKERGIDGVDIGDGRDQPVRRTGDAALDEGRLLGGAVLADRDRRGRRRDPPAQRQRLQRSRRNVLELGRDRVAHRGEAIESRRIEIVAPDVLVRDQPGRAVGVGIENDRAIAHRLRGVHEHPAELAAADDTEGRAGSEIRPLASAGGQPGRAGRHFRSAVIARAASRWRRR